MQAKLIAGLQMGVTCERSITAFRNFSLDALGPTDYVTPTFYNL